MAVVEWERLCGNFAAYNVPASWRWRSNCIERLLRNLRRWKCFGFFVRLDRATAARALLVHCLHRARVAWGPKAKGGGVGKLGREGTATTAVDAGSGLCGPRRGGPGSPCELPQLPTRYFTGIRLRPTRPSAASTRCCAGPSSAGTGGPVGTAAARRPRSTMSTRERAAARRRPPTWSPPVVPATRPRASAPLGSGGGMRLLGG